MSLAYEFSFSDVVNGTIGAVLIAIIGAAIRYIAPRLWEYAEINAKTRRKNNFIAIWKRIRSDEYFVARQKVEVLQMVMISTIAIVVLQLYDLGGRRFYIAGLVKASREENVWNVTIILFVVLESALSFLFMKETAYNQRALLYRMRTERRKSPRQAGAKRANSLSAGAGPRSAGPPPEPSEG